MFEFLPMTVAYAMAPDMPADAASAFRPKVPDSYHFGETDIAEPARLLAREKDIEVDIRKIRWRVTAHSRHISFPTREHVE